MCRPISASEVRSHRIAAATNDPRVRLARDEASPADGNYSSTGTPGPSFVRSGSKKLRGGKVGMIQRRIRRINLDESKIFL